MIVIFPFSGIRDHSLQGVCIYIYIYSEDASELLQVHAISVLGQFGKTHCDKGSSSSIKASSMYFNHLSHPSLMQYTTGIFPSSLEISFQNKLPTWFSIIHVWQYFLGVTLDTSIVPISYVLRKMLDDVCNFYRDLFPHPKWWSKYQNSIATEHSKCDTVGRNLALTWRNILSGGGLWICSNTIDLPFAPGLDGLDDNLPNKTC